MSRAFELIQSFRAEDKLRNRQAQSAHSPAQSARSPAQSDHSRRRRRAYIAFSAAIFVVAGGFFVAGSNIPGVVAQEGQNAAAFFRADRARMRARNVASRIPTLTIFGRNRGDIKANRRFGHRGAGAARREARARAAELKRLRAKGYAGARSVCVRLCDGFHFPVGAYTGPGDKRTHEAICSGLCPGAPTRLYVMKKGAQDIAEAISVARGSLYAALPVALRHTSKRDNTCSCRAPGQSHLALVSLRKDFTLRRGDAVMTRRGMRVFKGARRWPYRTRDFTSVRHARGLTRPQRRALYALERASTSRSIARQTRQRTASRTQVAGQLDALPAVGPLPPSAANQTRGRTVTLGAVCLSK